MNSFLKKKHKTKSLLNSVKNLLFYTFLRKCQLYTPNENIIITSLLNQPEHV